VESHLSPVKDARELLLRGDFADDRALAPLGRRQSERKRHGGLADAPLAGDDRHALLEQVHRGVTLPGALFDSSAGNPRCPANKPVHMGLFNRGSRNDENGARDGAMNGDGASRQAPAELPPEPEGEPVVHRSTEEIPAVERPDHAADELEPQGEPDADPEPTVTTTATATKVEATDEESRISVSEALAPSRSERPSDSDGDQGDGRTGGRMKVYAFANQKGGVAKTTTTLNLAVAFAESGYRVLAVDLDPQGNLTMSQGIDPDKVEKSLFDVLVHRMPLSEIVQKREIDIAVSSIDLAGAEIAMSTMIGRERALEKALDEVSGDYDFVCIDTPPSLGLLTVNALTAADKVIVPVQCEYLSMRGLVQLQNTLGMIKENLNPGVEIEGILPTMLDSRTVHAKEAVEILEENFGDLVFKSRIRKAIKFAEAPVRGASVLKYDPKGNAAEYYRDLAKEVLTHGAS
jgi:chromosome partitioning protein